MADAPALLTVRELKSPELNPGAPFAAVLVVKKLQIKTASNASSLLFDKWFASSCRSS